MVLVSEQCTGGYAALSMLDADVLAVAEEPIERSATCVLKDIEEVPEEGA